MSTHNHQHRAITLQYGNQVQQRGVLHALDVLERLHNNHILLLAITLITCHHLLIRVDVVIDDDHTFGVAREVRDILHTGAVTQLHAVAVQVARAHVVLIDIRHYQHAFARWHVRYDVNIVH